MNAFTIFIDRNIPLGAEVFAGQGDICIFDGRKLTNDDFKNKKNIILISRSQTKINEELLHHTDLLFCGTATSGTDHVDLDYLRAREIPFAEAKGSNANSVAEFVIYSTLKYANYYGIDLLNTKIGVIGYGSIGKIVSDYSFRLGLKVLINDPPLKDSGFIFPDKFKYADLSEIFNECTIVTNHVPLTYTGNYPTENLINGKLINNLTENSLLIHASRGGIADENALLARMENNGLLAVVDVWKGEPEFNPKLAELSYLAAPHAAGYSYDGKLKGTLMMAEAVEKYFNIKTNKEIILAELAKSLKIPIESISKNEIMQMLEESRQFGQDTAEFKKIAQNDVRERNIGFDEMRKNYPKRRETLI